MDVLTQVSDSERGMERVKTARRRINGSAKIMDERYWLSLDLRRRDIRSRHDMVRQLQV